MVKRPALRVPNNDPFQAKVFHRRRARLTRIRWQAWPSDGETSAHVDHAAYRPFPSQKHSEQQP